MEYNRKELADKAVNGDEESLDMLVLLSPGEEMGDMEASEFAKHVASCPDESPEEDVGAVMDVLQAAGIDEEQAMEVSSGIFQALGYY